LKLIFETSGFPKPWPV